MKKKRLLILSAVAVSATLLLSACGSNVLFESAEKVEKKTEKVEKETVLEKEYQEQINQWKEMYANPEQSVEDALDDLEKEKVGETVNVELIERDAYTVPHEMAKFVSQTLFDFSNGTMSPEDYVAFLTKYASSNMLEMTLTLEQQNDIELMKMIQQNIIDSGVKYESYSFSTPKIVNDTVTFHRKMVTTDGRTAYHITELTKLDNGVLLFNSDDMSMPVEF